MFTGKLGLITIATLCLFGVSSAKINNNIHDEVKKVHKLEANEITDLSSATQITEDILKVKVVSSNISNGGQSVGITFSTGGDSFLDSSGTYNIVSDDADFETFYEEFIGLTLEQKDAAAEAREEIPVFSSYIYKFNGKSNRPEIVIPKTSYRSNYFALSPTVIGEGAFSKSENTDFIKQITIPNTISTITADAFDGIPSSVVFNVEAPKDLDGYEAGWNHGCKVNYSYDYETKFYQYEDDGSIKYGGASNRAFPSLANVVAVGDINNNFYIGHYSPEINKPLKLQYKLKGGDEVYEFSCERTSVNSEYDSVGQRIKGYSTALVCDIPLDEGKEIDISSITVLNIYSVDFSSGRAAFDDSTMYYAKPEVVVTENLYFNEFAEVDFAGITTFGNYSNLQSYINVKETGIYEKLNYSFYKQYQPKIENNEVYLRYRVTGLSKCVFDVIYDDNGVQKEKAVTFRSPVNQVVLNSTSSNFLSFMLENSQVDEGFNGGKIKAITFKGLSITVDLFGEKGPVGRSAATTRFGFVKLMKFGTENKTFDAGMFVILEGITYVVVFAGATMGLYFFFKNKYKNDEFKRVKPKEFFKKAALFLGGGAVVLYAITFIILRLTALSNSVVSFNPADAFIVILGMVSVVILGYFIKYLVQVFKTNKARRAIIKLKLNETIEDDGTSK